MVVFKIIDEFSREIGKKIGERKAFSHHICDFTGEKMDVFYGNPCIYEVDYNDTDPCFGDHEAERWLYKWNSQFEDEEGEGDNMSENDIDAYELFGQTKYIFGTHEDGTEVFADLLKAVKAAKFEVVSLDHLLRWSRGRMLEKLFKEGKYKPTDFIQ